MSSTTWTLPIVGQVTGYLSAHATAHVTTPLTQFLGEHLPQAAVCPQAPPGAVGPTNQLTGYVLWGVGILFIVGLIVGLGAVVGGRVFAMPHASKGGVVALVVVFVAAVAYLVLPSMLDGILGDGCI